MTIDTNELRRLAQAATHPTTKGRWIRLFGERTVYDRMEDGCRGVPIVATDYHPPSPKEAAYLDFIAAANPAAISELLDRLEAGEKERDWHAERCEDAMNECDALRAEIEAAERERDECNRRRLEAADHFAAQTALMKKKYDDLRAKIEQMEQQEPVGVLHVGSYYGEELEDWEFEADQRVCDHLNERHVSNPTSLKLYALPGAQPAPSMPEVTDAMALAFHHALTDGSIGAREVEEIKDALRAALAAAPEAKP